MQSKKHSMLESVTNVAVGFVITLVFSPFIYTLCGMEYTWGQLGWVTLIFTALSIARSYVIRRFFNKKTDKPDENKLYSEIEDLIIRWNNDGTKTAGSLTREIMEEIRTK
jgi:hypothetical protein